MLTSSVTTMPPNRSRVHASRGRRAGGGAIALLALAVVSACGSSHSTAVRKPTPTSTVRAIGTPTGAAPTPAAPTGAAPATATATAQTFATVFVATNSSGDQSANALIYALATANGALKWRDTSPGAITATAFNFNNTVLFEGIKELDQFGQPLGGTMRAIAASTGAQMWQRAYAGSPVAVPIPLAASGDVVFVGLSTMTTGGAASITSVEALRSSDGSVAWSVPLQGTLARAASASDGSLYLITSSTTSPGATATYTLLALSGADGKPRWSLALPGAPLGPSLPILTDGVLYLADANPLVPTPGPMPTGTLVSFVALNASDGSILWQRGAGTPQDMAQVQTILINGGIIYFLSIPGWHP
ncbi:MAG TPA: PQQ-binding-like beta-propeller repeat protein, partial [Ktedonobacterales bacterium]|nr:PQQ-binding-like beta-propeller repeat protein [Ktedonobacterales bacterium]